MTNHPPRNLHSHVDRVAESVATTWARAHRSGRLDVPLSVVAAYAVAEPHDPAGPSLTNQLETISPQIHQRVVRDLYGEIVRTHPEHTAALYPLIAWTVEDDAPAEAALEVAKTAMTAGLWDITRTEARLEIDLLGHVLATLRSDTGRKQAAIYTPAPVADLLGRIMPPAPGTAVHEPALGTGRLWRGAAQGMRAAGNDPATVTWFGADLDSLAVAAAVVNSLLWGLGPNVVLAVANSLTDPDWPTQAVAQQDELRCIAATATAFAAVIALTSPPADTNVGGDTADPQT